MYCIFDTETSGLADFRAPADAPGQPRLASIAMIAVDEALNLVAATSVLIRPEGWEMSPEATKVNGLTQEMLLRHGVPIREVLWRYSDEIERGATLVAHNVQFDTKVMRGEMRRAGMSDMFSSTATVCTMRTLTDRVCMPSSTGRGFKWPRLSEAVETLLKRDHRDAHGCLPDALACLDLFRWMKANAVGPFSETGVAA